jgi:hypothetical protein
MYGIIDRARDMMEKLGRKLSAMTVAAPGPIDTERGIIIDPRNFKWPVFWWRGEEYAPRMGKPTACE